VYNSEIGVVMKRRFRQKQDSTPKDDPERKKELSEDYPEENIKIDDVIEEIETFLKTQKETPEKE
jgi:hypothetical protein